MGRVDLAPGGASSSGHITAKEEDQVIH